MDIGVTFPQTEIGNDPIAIRDYAHAVEQLGYRSILAYDHVLGASLANRPEWIGPYNSETPFHEPFVLFGYLAGLTSTIELVTGVLVLPQRQTALVAKQAAQVDLLSGGRLRLGVGLGWNQVEYDSLAMDFHDRGARCDEQIEVLRLLWTDHAVSFQGRWHTIDEAGLNPLPPSRAIPIWIGGVTEAALRRAGRLGDGWITFRDPDDDMATKIEFMHGVAREAGRSPEDVGVEGALMLSWKDPALWPEIVDAWRALGARSLTVNTMGLGLAGPADHLTLLARLASELGVS